MTKMNDTDSQLPLAIQEALERVRAQREEILEAFLAKYGCQPDEIVQIEKRTENGWRWWVERQNVDEARRAEEGR